MEMPKPRIIVEIRAIVSHIYSEYHGEKTIKQWAKLTETKEIIISKFISYTEDLPHPKEKFKMAYYHTTRELYISALLPNRPYEKDISIANQSIDMIGDRFTKAGLSSIIQK